MNGRRKVPPVRLQRVVGGLIKFQQVTDSGWPSNDTLTTRVTRGPRNLIKRFNYHISLALPVSERPITRCEERSVDHLAAGKNAFIRDGGGIDFSSRAELYYVVRIPREADSEIIEFL